VVEGGGSGGGVRHFSTRPGAAALPHVGALKLIQGRIECEFSISGHTQKSEDFETYRRN